MLTGTSPYTGALVYNGAPIQIPTLDKFSQNNALYFGSEKAEEIFKTFQLALRKKLIPNPLLEKLASIHKGQVFVEISGKDCDLSLKSMAELFRQFALLQR